MVDLGELKKIISCIKKMSTSYIKNYDDRVGCRAEPKYYTHNNLFKYADQNAQRPTASAKTVAKEGFCGCKQYSHPTEEDFCSGSGCQAPNVMLYQPANKVDYTGCNSQTNKDCWVGVL